MWHRPFTSLFAKSFKWRFFVYLFFLQRYKILLSKIMACTSGDCKKIDLADLFLWGKTFCSKNTIPQWPAQAWSSEVVAESLATLDLEATQHHRCVRSMWAAASCTTLMHLWKQQAPRDTALCPKVILHLHHNFCMALYLLGLFCQRCTPVCYSRPLIFLQSLLGIKFSSGFSIMRTL